MKGLIEEVISDSELSYLLRNLSEDKQSVNVGDYILRLWFGEVF